jgi:glycosyltransferase involved in cell wall biosynthesis
MLIYAEPLLARSMTFVRSQALALKKFSPCFIGPHYLQNGLILPEGQVEVMGRGNVFSKVAALPFKAFGWAPFFVRRLSKLQPVLLHAHFGPMGLRALPLARALKIPLIVTFHGYDATISDELGRQSKHFAHRTYVERRKELEREAALFVAVSKFIRDELLRKGFPSDKIVVHYIGVDTQFFHPERAIAREPLVLFVGRLEEVKGCDFLVRAMAKVQSSMPHVGLVIAGDGSKRHELERMARGSLRNCHFLGFQSPEEVKGWMNRASVLAAPSVRTASEAEEGCGLVILEAQAMGLPVVGFSSGGIPEAVCHEKTGFLSRERDWSDLANNILLLLQDGSLWSRMSEAAQERTNKLFNLQSQAEKLETIYDAVLSSSRGCGLWQSNDSSFQREPPSPSAV